FSDQGLEFGKGHLDGVEIGAVGRQEHEPGANVPQGFCCLRAVMAGEIIQNDNVTPVQRWGELGVYVGLEAHAVHRSTEHPRRIQTVVAQGGDEGLGAPVAEGAWSTSRSPRGAHPLVLHMLVFRDVSSMKPRRGRKLRMKGCRWRIQHCLASHTSDRFCSTARMSFFICQTKTLKKTAN